MALPDAFDQLDLTWRLPTGEHLVRIPRVAPGLAPLVDNWPVARNHLQAITVQALDTIRAEIASLTLDNGQ
jgi:hypothetical protein